MILTSVIGVMLCLVSVFILFDIFIEYTEWNHGICIETKSSWVLVGEDPNGNFKYMSSNFYNVYYLVINYKFIVQDK